ncbi:hypothetical protein NDA16_000008 [Ustilago loliicola]|nr:hypothetical protein NDA16_000008 [Ustilago loliicola]
MTASPLAYLTPDPSSNLEGVYHLVLDRPEARNAISRALLQDVLHCPKVLLNKISQPSSEEPYPRVLILRANGPCFCAGADLKERSEMSEIEAVEFLQSLRQMLDQVEKLPIPTLAAIDGPALGGGLELALACDFRIAAESVDKIGFPEVKLGIIPGAGGTQRAPRVIGMDLAEQMIPAAPLALRAAKMAISLGSDVDLARGLDLEWACYEPLLDSRDRREALNAFQQKRKPVFVGK